MEEWILRRFLGGEAIFQIKGDFDESGGGIAWETSEIKIGDSETSGSEINPRARCNFGRFKCDGSGTTIGIDESNGVISGVAGSNRFGISDHALDPAEGVVAGLFDLGGSADAVATDDAHEHRARDR